MLFFLYLVTLVYICTRRIKVVVVAVVVVVVRERIPRALVDPTPVHERSAEVAEIENECFLVWTGNILTMDVLENVGLRNHETNSNSLGCTQAFLQAVTVSF